MGHCLICGISRVEVDAVRKREGYTLGCGIESNTEAGFYYDELSPRHRWRPWKDSELTRMGIKPEVVEHYRTAQALISQIDNLNKDNNPLFALGVTASAQVLIDAARSI